MDWAEIYVRFRRDENDSDAWDALQHRVSMWARPELWDRGWHVVDDAIADTCSSVVMSLDNARGAATFSGFVKGHYLNVRHRILASRPTVPLGADHENASEPDPDETSEDERALLQQCLDRLPPRERRAVTLRYFEEAAAARIAAILEVTEVNARRIVFNGLAHLRQCVKQAASPEAASETRHR